MVAQIAPQPCNWAGQPDKYNGKPDKIVLCYNIQIDSNMCRTLQFNNQLASNYS